MPRHPIVSLTNINSTIKVKPCLRSWLSLTWPRTRNSLPCSQESTTASCAALNESSPHHHTLWFNTAFPFVRNVLFPSCLPIETLHIYHLYNAKMHSCDTKDDTAGRSLSGTGWIVSSCRLRHVRPKRKAVHLWRGQLASRGSAVMWTLVYEASCYRRYHSCKV
jgi:hypothetical protein